MKELVQNGVFDDDQQPIVHPYISKNRLKGRIEKWLKRIYWSTYYLLHTNTSSDGVEYIYKRRDYDRLVIVFTSMVGRFNFIRSLKDAPYDQLFIRDCWAGNASYYWFEGKQDYPELFTQNLIDQVLAKGIYKEVITLGGSKGGTSAIYYGLKNNFDLVFAGACQYMVGDYLAKHQYVSKPWQWEKVVGGEPTKEWIDILNQKLEKMIDAHKNTKTIIKLVYSTEEHTYPEHLAFLIKKLDECNIQHDDHIESFTKHSMSGLYLKQDIEKYFTAK